MPQIKRDNLQHIIPEEIDSESKIGRFLSFFDLAVVFLFMYCSDYLKPLIHPSFRLPFTIYTVIVGIILIIPSPANGNKKIYHTLFYMLLKRRVTYHSTNDPYEPEDSGENLQEGSQTKRADTANKPENQTG